VLDMDGVLWKDYNTIIPGADEALRLLHQNNIPILFITNGGGTPITQKAEKLADTLKVSVDPQTVVCSHSPMKPLADRYREKRVLLIGLTEQLSTAVAHELGLKNFITIEEYSRNRPFLVPQAHLPPELMSVDSEEPIAAIIMLHVPKDWGVALQICCDLLQSDGVINSTGFKIQNEQIVDFYSANPDFSYPSQFPVPRFTSGAFMVCLKNLYEKITERKLRYTLYGKPRKNTYEYAENLFRTKYKELPHKIYAVGDNPYSDIRGANEAGERWHSILVKTGNFQGETNHPVYPAKTVCYDVLEATKWIINNENRRNL